MLSSTLYSTVVSANVQREGEGNSLGTKVVSSVFLHICKYPVYAVTSSRELKPPVIKLEEPRKEIHKVNSTRLLTEFPEEDRVPVGDWRASNSFNIFLL
jgi:hypothetical protein